MSTAAERPSKKVQLQLAIRLLRYGVWMMVGGILLQGISQSLQISFSLPLPVLFSPQFADASLSISRNVAKAGGGVLLAGLLAGLVGKYHCSSIQSVGAAQLLVLTSIFCEIFGLIIFVAHCLLLQHPAPVSFVFPCELISLVLVIAFFRKLALFIYDERMARQAVRALMLAAVCGSMFIAARLPLALSVNLSMACEILMLLIFLLALFCFAQVLAEFERIFDRVARETSADSNL